MPAAYPIELRERAVAAYERGGFSLAEVAKLFGIGEASLKRWTWRKRDTGSVAAFQPGGSKGTILDDSDREYIRWVVQERSDIYVRELVEVVADVRGKRVSRSTMTKELFSLGLSRKKGRGVRSDQSRL